MNADKRSESSAAVMARIGVMNPLDEGKLLHLKIDRLHTEFEKLRLFEQRQLIKNDKQKLQLEKRKLAILHEIEKILESFTWKRIVPQKEAQQPQRWYKLRLLGYIVTTVGGMMMSAIGNFLGALDLMHLIPGLSNPLILALCTVTTLVNSVLFFIWEAGPYRDAFGIKARGWKSKDILLVHNAQIKATEHVNAMFFDLNNADNMAKKLESQPYLSLKKMLKQLNDNIVEKKHQLKDKEHPFIKGLSWAMNGVGAAMVTSGGYFMITALLSTFAAGIMATPVGWGIIGLAMTISLACYIAVRSTDSAGMLNPVHRAFQNVKAKLERFAIKDDFDFYVAHQTYNKLHQYNAAKQADVAVGQGMAPPNTPTVSPPDSPKEYAPPVDCSRVAFSF